MKGAITKLTKLILQIGGIAVTLVVVAIVRTLLQRGYRLEAYSATVGVVILTVMSWVFRAWWLKKKGLNSQQKKLFEIQNKSTLPAKYLKTTGLVISVLLVLGIIAGLFFWYEIRPSKSRVECDLTAREKANITKDPIRAYSTFYDVCLHSKGL